MGRPPGPWVTVPVRPPVTTTAGYRTIAARFSSHICVWMAGMHAKGAEWVGAEREVREEVGWMGGRCMGS
eukprot:366413-Chlamydomonas_euryale.AAC.15